MMFTDNLAFSLFVPQAKPGILALYIAACLVFGVLFLVGLTLMPRRLRRPIVMAVTFVLGLFYFVEFMFPGMDMAPLRDRLGSAEAQLRLAEQDVYTILVHPSTRPDRVAAANRALDAADRELAGAKSLIDGLKPDAEKGLKQAEDDADRWAEENKVPDTVPDGTSGKSRPFLDRGPDRKINDIHTQTFKNRIQYLTAAADRASSIRSMIGENRAVLSNGAKQKLNEFRATLDASADSLELSRANLTDNWLTPYLEPFGNAVIVIGALSIGLGIISLATVHGKAIAKRRPGWHNSLAFYISMVSIATFGFLQAYLQPTAVHPGPFKSFCSSAYYILYFGALNPLSATMFSLVAFYIVSAGYRAFRVKSGESALMMVAAFIVMLGIVPFGVLITSWLPTHGWQSMFRLENITHWILLFPNAAAQRGIQFGIGVGFLAMSLRLWLSLERGSYFDKEM